jgi:hypothetical protein
MKTLVLLTTTQLQNQTNFNSFNNQFNQTEGATEL